MPFRTISLFPCHRPLIYSSFILLFLLQPYYFLCSFLSDRRRIADAFFALSNKKLVDSLHTARWLSIYRHRFAAVVSRDEKTNDRNYHLLDRSSIARITISCYKYYDRETRFAKTNRVSHDIKLTEIFHEISIDYIIDPRLFDRIRFLRSPRLINRKDD